MRLRRQPAARAARAIAGVAVSCLATLAAAAGPLRVAAFRCDATPPVGEPLIWATNLVSVEAPLLAKGVVLEDGADRYVICAIDWCLLCNESERSFRRSIAAGAGTDPARVAIQCVHQHAAPYADEDAHRLIDAAPSPLTHLSTGFLDTVRARLAQVAAEAVRQLQPFDQVGTGEARVERVASIRRLRGANGKPLTRFSTAGTDKAMAEAPEGDTDPMLRTVTLARAGRPLVRLHYYATHPQTFSCDGRASSDFVGAARETIERGESVPQIYFTGCGGDVTVGKYNDKSPEAFSGLTLRLADGIRRSIASTRFAAADGLTWRTQHVTLPLRGEPMAVAAESRGWLENPKQSDGMRVYEGAMRLAFVNRRTRPLEVSSLQLGSVWIVHLPGEPMLEFQRFARGLRPDAFVVAAGYGDCSPAYICTDQAIAEGGYEPAAANVGAGSEAQLKQAIRRLLDAGAPSTDPAIPNR